MSGKSKPNHPPGLAVDVEHGLLAQSQRRESRAHGVNVIEELPVGAVLVVAHLKVLPLLHLLLLLSLDHLGDLLLLGVHLDQLPLPEPVLAPKKTGGSSDNVVRRGNIERIPVDQATVRLARDILGEVSQQEAAAGRACALLRRERAWCLAHLYAGGYWCAQQAAMC